MKLIIFDIDDVIRDLRHSIEKIMDNKFKGKDWGKYDYFNENIKEVMREFENNGKFYTIFENPIPNYSLLSFIKSKKIEDKYNIKFLSANQCHKSRKLTEQFINNSFIGKEVIFVDRWFQKIDYVNNKISKKEWLFERKDVLMVDDRLGTIKLFDENGYDTFWYLYFYEFEVAKNNMIQLGYSPKNKGLQDDFEKFLGTF